MGDWITTREAAEILCVNESTLLSVANENAEAFNRKPARLGATSYSRNGVLWLREEILDVVNIQSSCSVRFCIAVRVLRAMKLELI